MGLECVCKVSEGCLEGVMKESCRCVEGSGGHMEGVWRASGRCRGVKPTSQLATQPPSLKVRESNVPSIFSFLAA